MKISLFENMLPLLLIAVFVLVLYPNQNSEAFVTNQAASKILGSSDPSAILSLGLTGPRHAAFDSSGNLWVADYLNNRVLMYPKANLASGGAATVALGQPNLSSNTANNGGLSANTLNNPAGIAFDSSGNLWVADVNNNRVLMFPRANLATGGAATVVLGQTSMTSNSPGTTATTLSGPYSLAFDLPGNLWVTDINNNRVLEFPQANLATGGAATVALGQSLLTTGGSGTTANTLNNPAGIAFDSSGNLWVIDFSNNRVLMYPHASFATNEAATIALGQDDLLSGSPGSGDAGLFNPIGLAFDSSGNLWVTDFNNNRVIKYPQANLATGGAATVALGQPNLSSNTANNGGTASGLWGSIDLAFDTSGNIWVSDYNNNRVVKYPQSNLVTAGTATVVLGEPDMIHNDANDVGLSATTLGAPRSLTFDSSGNLWVADLGNNRILEYPQATLATGGAATIALGQTSLSTDGSGTAATTLHFPIGLAFDSSENLWVVDQSNNRILEYPQYNLATGGAATVVLGQSSFTTGSSGTTATKLNVPAGLAFDSSGNLWVADSSNNRVLMYPQANLATNGAATVALGQGSLTTGGSGTTAITLHTPVGLAFDSSGNLWVADDNNNRVLEYPQANLVTGGAATVVLGQGSLTTGTSGTAATTLHFPSRIGFDSSGNLWVADQSNNRIIKYPLANLVTGGAATSALGQSSLTTSSSGSSATALNLPTGPAFDSSGNLWIADNGNNRIIEYENLPTTTLTSSSSLSTGSNTLGIGNLQTTFQVSNAFTNTNIVLQQVDVNPESSSPSGTTTGEFYQIITNSPDIISSRTITLSYTKSDVAELDESSLKINRFSNGVWTQLTTTVDTTHHKVNATTSGFSTFAISGTANSHLIIGNPTGQGEFKFQVGVTVDSSGNIYVADTGNNRVQKFDSSGNFLLQFGINGTKPGQFVSPVDIAVDSSGNIYVADSGNYRVEKFDPTGNFLLQFGTSGSDPGQFDGLNDVVVNGTNIFTADGGNNRMQIFDLTGNFKSQFGSSGSGNGQFSYPADAAVDSLGNIYVADASNNRVEKFDSSGDFLASFGSLGSGNSQFTDPEGVAVDSSGNIYVADSGNNRVQKLSSSGTFLSHFGTLGSGNGQFFYPVDMATDSSGKVYVSDLHNSRIQKFDSSGTFLMKIGTIGDSHFRYPVALAFDNTGNVLVSDSNSFRVQKFSTSGTFLSKFGSFGTDNGQFDFQIGIANDTLGNIYVADTSNNRIEKFDSSGNFLLAFGSNGTGNGQFNYPEGIAVSTSGKIYVADSGNNRIQKFSSSGAFQSKFGSFGTGNGQFNFPTTVSLDSSGNIYVADDGNNRIEKFDSSGDFTLAFGSYGSDNGQFSSPSATVDKSGKIYVADTGNNRIQIFDSSGNFLSKFGSSGTADGQFNSPSTPTVDYLGNIYVPDSSNGRIQKFSPFGTFLSTFGSSGSGNGQFNSVQGVAVDSSGNIYVVDTSNNRIQKFDSAGNYMSKFGSSGSGNGDLSDPFSATVDSSGNIYVADRLNNRIQKFDSTGGFVLKFGSLGSGNGQFSDPEGIALDSSGNIYVADTSNDRIQKFNSTGGFVSKFGSFGSGNGQFNVPIGIALDSSGNIYVADRNNIRIQKFNSTGGFVLKFGSLGSGNGQFLNPQGVTVDSSGSIYVTDTSNKNIQKFSPTGTFLSTFGSSGSGNGQLSNPFSATVDSSGNIYVADTGNDRIQKFRASETFVSQIGSSITGSPGNGQFNFAAGTAFGSIYVADANNNQIQKFDSSGNFVSKFGTTGTGPGQFNFIHAIANDTFGNVFVTDTNNNRIQKFDSSGNFLTQFGSSGSGNGQFNFPTSIALNKTGYIYVSDGDNNRIQKFATVYNFSSNFGSFGSGNGQFNIPISIVLDSSGNIYVLDQNNNRVQKFNSVGVYQSQFGSFGTGNGQLSGPISIAIDSSGNIYVVDQNNNRVQKFNSTGVYQSQFGSSGSGNGQFNDPTGITIDSSGNIYVADTTHNRIEKFDSSGNFLSQFGSTGSGNGQFSSPINIAIDSSGNIYVVDKLNNRIQKFDSTGVYQSQFGSSGSGNGQFNTPINIAIDSSGNIYVTDYGNSRVQKFNSAGVYLSQFGSLGSGNGQFDGPEGIVLDSSGNIYVADSSNSRVQKFIPTYNFVSTFGSFGSGNGQLNFPHHISLDSSGNVYVVDAGNNRIQKFSASGNYLSQFGSSGSGNGQFNNPQGVAVDSYGIIFVADGGNDRIQWFDSSGGFIAKFGSSGTGPSQFNFLHDVALDSSGNLYVSEEYNNRVQKFANPVFHPAPLSLSLSEQIKLRDFVVAFKPIQGPSISAITASNPSANGYVSGAKITVQFSNATNLPFKTLTNNHLVTANIDNLFSFSGVPGNTIGNSYTGIWTNPSTFVITIQDPGTVTSTDLISHLKLQVKSGANLKNSAGTSLVSTSLSPVLVGSFGFPSAPLINAFVVEDPNNGVNTFHIGDVFTIKFSEPTNEPGGTGVQNTISVDSFLKFTNSIGRDYSGQWIDTSTFKITINDATNGNPKIDHTTVTVNGTNLKNQAGTSLTSTSQSPTLSGSFGTFTVTQQVVAGGTAVTTLPTGITAQITLPSDSSGSVTINKTTASTTGSSGTINFLGNVVDISPPPGACQSGCTFTFTFTDDDLSAASITRLSDVVIYHDHNGDGAFTLSDEILATTVTPSSAPGPYVATATDDRTSKFAIGGVVPALAILGHGGGSSPPPSFTLDNLIKTGSLPDSIKNAILNHNPLKEIVPSNDPSVPYYPLSIDGKGYLVAGHTSTLQTMTEKTGTPVNLQLVTFADSIQHIALYTNLHDANPQIPSSDTYVIYDKGQSLHVVDPHKLFNGVSFDLVKDGNIFKINYGIKFAKTMSTSDIIIRVWNDEQISSDTNLLNAWQVVQGTSSDSTVGNIVETKELSNTPKTIPTQSESLNIPFWVKHNADWWSSGKIKDSDFTKGVQYLVDQKIIVLKTKSGISQTQQIPSWVKNNAGWWASGQITDSDFVKGMQYIITRGMVKTGS